MASVNKITNKPEHFSKQEFIRQLSWNAVEKYLPHLTLKQTHQGWIKSYKGVDLQLFEPQIKQEDDVEPSPFTIQLGDFASAAGVRARNAYAPNTKYGDKKVTLAFSLDEFGDAVETLAGAMRELHARLIQLLSDKLAHTDWAPECTVVNNADQLRITVHNDPSSRYNTLVFQDGASASRPASIFKFGQGHRCAFTFTPAVWVSRPGGKRDGHLTCGVNFNAIKIVGDLGGVAVSEIKSAASSSSSAAELEDGEVKQSIDRIRPAPLIRTVSSLDVTRSSTPETDYGLEPSSDPTPKSNKRRAEEAEPSESSPPKRQLRSRNKQT